MDMGIVKKRIIIDVGPGGGTPNFKCRDDQRIFWGLKVLIPGFFGIRKFGEYFFGYFLPYIIKCHLNLKCGVPHLGVGLSGQGVKKELCVGRPCEGKIPTSNMALKQWH